MFRFLTVLTALALLVPATLLVAAEEKTQTKCPVSGESIDKAKSPHFDYQGQRIYLCCPACQPKFEADAEKYFAAIAADGVVLENIQTKCAVRGEDLEKKTSYLDYKGRRVYFCCDMCKEPFMKDPAKYLNGLPGTQQNSTSK